MEVKAIETPEAEANISPLSDWRREMVIIFHHKKLHYPYVQYRLSTFKIMIFFFKCQYVKTKCSIRVKKRFSFYFINKNGTFDVVGSGSS